MSSQNLDVMFYGAAHMDRLGKTNEKPVAGRSNPGQFIERAGGAAFNSAGIMATCGLKVGLSTILGDDAAGHSVRRTAETRGIILDAQSGETTASYTAILAPDGDLVVALADMAIYEDYQAPALPQTTIAVLDANLPEAAIAALFNRDQKFCALATSMAKAPRLGAFLKKLDCLFCNVGELKALTGSDDMGKSLDDLMNAGMHRAVVSDGSGKVWIAEAGSVRTVPVPRIENVRDVTGAGDALAALALVGLIKGLSLEKAVQLGIRAAQALLLVDGPYRKDIADVCGLKPLSSKGQAK